MQVRDRKKEKKPEPAQRPRAKRRIERERFARARNAEHDYARQLRQIARHIGALVTGTAPDGNLEDDDLHPLIRALLSYGEAIRPWATAVATRMILDVSRRDLRAWNEHAKQMGIALRQEMATAPTGIAMRKSLQEQVDLITSLPRRAAERVHKLTIEAQATGVRSAETAREILKTGKVTESRANLIARTETSRAASELTKARAMHVGSTHYIWRTVGDSDVRPLHQKLNGQAFRWDDPPVTGDNGERSLPGGVYNCRCYSEPVLPETL